MAILSVASSYRLLAFYQEMHRMLRDDPGLAARQRQVVAAGVGSDTDKNCSTASSACAA
jgi:hypothetical protein